MDLLGPTAAGSQRRALPEREGPAGSLSPTEQAGGWLEPRRLEREGPSPGYCPLPRPANWIAYNGTGAQRLQDTPKPLRVATAPASAIPPTAPASAIPRGVTYGNLL